MCSTLLLIALGMCVQASLVDQKAQQHLGPHQQTAPASGRPAVSDVATPGLQNQTGEYNCFLNVIVQCLWHCHEFRKGLLCLGPQLLQARKSNITMQCAACESFDH